MQNSHSEMELEEKEHSDGSDNFLKQAIALSTGDLMRTSLNVYVSSLSSELEQIAIAVEGEILLNKLIDDPNSGFTNRDSFRRIILTSLAQDIMYIIWRESDCIEESSLKEAGIRREFNGRRKHITRNSLKNAIYTIKGYNNPSMGDALKRSVDRICDALEVYGLTKRDTIRKNLKPIKGTSRLHTLMLNAHTDVSYIFAEQMQFKGDTDDE